MHHTAPCAIPFDILLKERVVGVRGPLVMSMDDLCIFQGVVFWCISAGQVIDG